MDPDETLAQIRELLEEGNSDEAGLMFHHLDDWLSKGGFLPRDWSHARQEAHRSWRGNL